MSVKILEKFARHNGWSKNAQLSLLLEYIDAQGDDVSFARFLGARAGSGAVEPQPPCPSLDGGLRHTCEEEVECQGTDGHGGLTCLVRCSECGAEGETTIAVVDVDWIP